MASPLRLLVSTADLAWGAAVLAASLCVPGSADAQCSSGACGVRSYSAPAYSAPAYGIRDYVQSPLRGVSTDRLERELAGRHGRGIVGDWSLKQQNGTWYARRGSETKTWSNGRWVPSDSWGDGILSEKERELKRENSQQQREIENLRYKLRQTQDRQSDSSPAVKLVQHTDEGGSPAKPPLDEMSLSEMVREYNAWRNKSGFRAPHTSEIKVIETSGSSASADVDRLLGKLDQLGRNIDAQNQRAANVAECVRQLKSVTETQAEMINALNRMVARIEELEREVEELKKPPRQNDVDGPFKF